MVLNLFYFQCVVEPILRRLKRDGCVSLSHSLCERLRSCFSLPGCCEKQELPVSLHTSRLSTSQGNVSGQDEGACLVCVEKAPGGACIYEHEGHRVSIAESVGACLR